MKLVALAALALWIPVANADKDDPDKTACKLLRYDVAETFLDGILMHMDASVIADGFACHYRASAPANEVRGTIDIALYPKAAKRFDSELATLGPHPVALSKVGDRAMRSADSKKILIGKGDRVVRVTIDPQGVEIASKVPALAKTIAGNL